jgi:hypothetical protein
MTTAERAKQFMPFSALKGLDVALAAKERIIVSKIDLSEDMSELLNQKMHLVQKGTLLTVIYFDTDTYLQKTGMVTAIDETARILQVVDTKISFDDIYDLTLERQASVN